MSQEQWTKIGKGALIALAGFAAAYITSAVIPQIDQTNTLGMALVAVFSIAANTLHKVATKPDEPVPPA